MTELLSSIDVSEIVDDGEVGGVSSEDSEGERCNLKSFGSGPETYKEL